MVPVGADSWQSTPRHPVGYYPCHYPPVLGLDQVIGVLTRLRTVSLVNHRKTAIALIGNGLQMIGREFVNGGDDNPRLLQGVFLARGAVDISTTPRLAQTVRPCFALDDLTPRDP